MDATRLRTWLVSLLLLTAAAGGGGCATHEGRLASVREDFFLGRLPEAESTLLAGTRKRPTDADVLRLEQATIQLVDGRPREAEQNLRTVRDRFDYLEQKSLAETGMSMMTDDNRLAYAGEDYEKVLIRVMLSISNLMHDGGDALAYALQVGECQNRLVQSKPGPRYAADAGSPPAGQQDEATQPAPVMQGPPIGPLAIGPYLYAAIREESFMDRDLVLRELTKVTQWRPQFRYAQSDLARAQQGVHCQRGNGVVYVFALVGKGPYKIEAIEPASSAALLIADQIISAMGDHTLPPTIAPVKVPVVVVPEQTVRAVDVSLAGGATPLGQTDTIMDVGGHAIAHARADHDRTVARAVVRRVLKKATVYSVKDATDQPKNSMGAMALDVAGVIWEAVERADTRCWGLLPDSIQVLRVELPAGTHRLRLAAVGFDGMPGPAYEADVTVADGRNTYALACFPTKQLVGQIASSHR